MSNIEIRVDFPWRKGVLGYYIYIVIIGILLAGQSASAGFEQLAESANIQNTLQDYLKNPSQEKAKALMDALPKDVPASSRTGQFAGISELVDRNWSALKERVDAGDAYVAEAVFRLLNFSDGLATESLTGLLGVLVQKYPYLYLSLLNKYRSSTYISLFGYPLLSSLAEMEPAEVMLADWGMRVEALKTVTDQNLIQLRDKCIDILNREIAGIQFIVKQHREYKQILDFLKIIGPAETPDAQFDVIGIPRWDIPKVMQFVSQSGVIFEDQNGEALSNLAYEEIEEELLSRKGISFEYLGRLGYQYFWMGNWALSFENIENNVTITLEGFFKLIFVKSDGQFKMISCKSLADDWLASVFRLCQVRIPTTMTSQAASVRHETSDP